MQYDEQHPDRRILGAPYHLLLYFVGVIVVLWSISKFVSTFFVSTVSSVLFMTNHLRSYYYMADARDNLSMLIWSAGSLALWKQVLMSDVRTPIIPATQESKFQDRLDVLPDILVFLIFFSSSNILRRILFDFLLKVFYHVDENSTYKVFRNELKKFFFERRLLFALAGSPILMKNNKRMRYSILSHMENKSARVLDSRFKVPDIAPASIVTLNREFTGDGNYSSSNHQSGLMAISSVRQARIYGKTVFDLMDLKKSGTLALSEITHLLVSNKIFIEDETRQIYETFGHGTEGVGRKATIRDATSTETRVTESKGSGSSCSMLKSKDLKQLCERLFTRHRTLYKSIKPQETAISSLSSMFNIVYYIIVFAIALQATGHDLLLFLSLVGTALISISFGLRTAVGRFIDSLIFVSYRQPFGIGDKIKIHGLAGNVTGDLDSFTVDDISIYHTKFITAYGERVYIPNTVLAGLRIDNQKRSTESQAGVSFNMELSLFTSIESREELRGYINQYIANNNGNWVADSLKMSCTSIGKLRCYKLIYITII
jgi:hypothetical protein